MTANKWSYLEQQHERIAVINNNKYLGEIDGCVTEGVFSHAEET